MATIQGIYVALFGRPADPTGLSYFNTVTKNGADLTGIGDLAGTAEYKERFAGQTNSQIVNSIYKSLFNRDAEPDGLKFFSDGLANGTFNIKNIAIAILDGARTTDLTIVNNKIAAADLFTKSLDNATKIDSYKGTAAAVIGRNFLINIGADTKIVQSDADKAVSSLPAPAAPLPAVLGQAVQQDMLTALNVSSISDPLFKSQWYLKNNGDRGPSAGLDVNITGAWADGYTGRGIRVAINDDGIDLNHAEFANNLLKNLTFNSINKVTGANAYGAGNGYTPAADANEHGTVVGSIVGMAADGKGMVGMAPNATLISGLAVAQGADVPALFNYMTTVGKVDVSVNSYGADPAFSENFLPQSPNDVDRTYLAAIENAGKQGRGGLGTVIEVSAGNKGPEKADAAMTGTTNNKYIITAGAMDEMGNKASYSTPGASVLVSSFGGENPNGKDQSDNSGFGIASADISGSSLGYNKTSVANGDYAFQNTGTSYSGPMVAATAALMLQANPLLGFRDVANILALTARPVGTTNNYIQVGGNLENFGGLQFSRDVGFGLIDVTAAVRLAASWTDTAKTAANWVSSEAKSGTGAATISSTGISVSATLTKNVIIERMEFDLTIDTKVSSDLKAVITSPTGTKITLFDGPMTNDDGTWPGTFQVGATAFFGEQSAGTWTLQLIDKNTGTVAQYKDLTVRAWGSDVTDDNHYVLTDAFKGTKTVTDTAGTDLIDAAAVSTGVTINLNAGQTSTVAGGTFTIAAGTQIENAFGGAGKDTLIGNDQGNILRGNGGADTLTGNGGADIFMYGKASESTPQAADTITDFTVGTDKIDVRLIDADLKSAGKQDLKFIGQATTLQADSLAFKYDGGNTIVFGDVDGDTSTVDFQVVLLGQKALTASDFLGVTALVA
ncbi:S8 family serine peptidase [Rhizobium oryzicola]|uniref:S8 family serine peptidase n=1 Tax=Rhizobium oryzicola TaxID=1232668 RepID=A0ABT8T4U9_9HYPH|nr:S8 family serine peptidase [Rhizobium oryzicola]MDO1585595.1 S8 family serine peptidase [Rhizobium oryzicola]